MKLVQVLGTGCPKCEKLLKNTERGHKIGGHGEQQVEKVSDINAQSVCNAITLL